MLRASGIAPAIPDEKGVEALSSANSDEVGRYKRVMREQQAPKVVMKSRTRIGISIPAS
jgi:hypothetical protein